MSLCCDEGEDGLILLWRATLSCMFLIALIVVVPFLLRVVVFFFFFLVQRLRSLQSFYGCYVLCDVCSVFFLASNGRVWRH